MVLSNWLAFNLKSDNSTDEMPKPPKTFLDLPREIYLNVCAYLDRKDLARLAFVSRDAYVAVQRPLYLDVHVDTFAKLKCLVRAFGGKPVVTRERQPDSNLSDAQLRDREVETLHILLDKTTTTQKIQGIEFARLIKEISSQNRNIDIGLSIYGEWYSFLTQLCRCEVPNVKRLIICTGAQGIPSDDFVHFGIWDACFVGTSFPDLEEVEVDNLFDTPKKRPDTLKSAALRSIYHPRSGSIPHRVAPTSFYGLKKIKNIKLRYSWITPVALERLFEDEYTNPKNLTYLEIANCANLHPVRNLGVLANLMRHALGLPHVQYLKLHAQRNQTSGKEWNRIHARYLRDNPRWHLCSIVQELGQKVNHLDLALPYVCSYVFSPPPYEASNFVSEKDWPASREPYESLGDRHIDQDYKHRRLICWQDGCGGNHEWKEMMNLADNQGETVSWELVNWQADVASWHVSGCPRVEYKANDVVGRTLPDAQR